MFSDFMYILEKTVSLSPEEKKARLVQIRKNQLITEALTKNDDLPATSQLEAMIILQSLFPMDSIDTIDKIIEFKKEIDSLAHQK